MERKILTLILFLAAFIVIYFIADFSFNTGFSYGYDEGKANGTAEGFVLGNKSGFESGQLIGYKRGWIEGNISGREEGFKVGFREGNLTGYTIGRSEGYNSGYNSGYSEGYNVGQSDGYSKGYSAGLNDSIPHKYQLRDPTYNEVLLFLSSDNTDKNQYIGENFKYVCTDFSSDVCKNAQKLNLDCHVVEIVFKDAEGAHMVVAFNTIDKGWKFFEPQDDREVKVDVGVRFYRDNNYLTPEGVIDDTIIKRTIFP